MADLQLVDYLCKLAKLSYTDTEKQKVARDLDSIMAVMDTIKDVEIDADAYPMAFPGKQADLREDTVCPSLPVDEALSNVPDRKYHFIAVKKIME